MKKMQCEVCGGVTIKKVADDLFECQNCGVQYNKNDVQKLLVEITGEVKIDHSNDAERMVKRAKQYEEKGDTEKATEYYEKALDYDPDNEELQRNVNKENDVLENQYVLPANIESEKAFDNLLGSIASKDNLIPDFFTDFKIISKEEKYYPFVMYLSEVKGNYMATACYNVEVPYVTTKTERVRLSNGTYINKEVPVTKTRTEVNRTPVSGFFDESVANLYSISPELNTFILSDKISANTVDKFDAYDKSEDDGNACNIKMFNDLEITLKRLIISERENLVPFFKTHFKANQDKTAEYDGFEVAHDTKDRSWAERASTIFPRYVDDMCRSTCRISCPGDFNENLTYSVSSEKNSKLVVWVPIQIVEYTYKDKTFKSLQIMNSKFSQISFTYPEDEGSFELEINLNEKKSNAYVSNEISKLMYTIGGGCIGILSLSKILCGDFGFGNTISGILLLVGFICLGIGGIKELSVKRRIKATEKLVEEQNIYINSYIYITNTFLKIYFEEHNIEKAVLKAREINDSNPYDGFAVVSLCPFVETLEFEALISLIRHTSTDMKLDNLEKQKNLMVDSENSNIDLIDSDFEFSVNGKTIFINTIEELEKKIGEIFLNNEIGFVVKNSKTIFGVSYFGIETSNDSNKVFCVAVIDDLYEDDVVMCEGVVSVSDAQELLIEFVNGNDIRNDIFGVLEISEC